MPSESDRAPHTLVIIQNRNGVDLHAVRVGSMLFSDGFQSTYGQGWRVFWLLDYHVQVVYEPWSWKQTWYVDIVDIVCTTQEATSTYKVQDLDVDIVGVVATEWADHLYE